MGIQKAKAAPATREVLDHKLLAIGRCVLEMEGLEAQMNAEIDTVKERFAARLEQLRTSIEVGRVDLRLAVEDSRQDLFKGRSKTLKLLFGKLGFRVQKATIRLLQGIKTEDAVRLLERNMLSHCVRVKKELGKDRIAKSFAAETLPADLLKRCGLDVRPGGEDFWFKPDQASIRKQMEKDGG